MPLEDKVITTIFPRIYARSYNAYTRARYVFLSKGTRTVPFEKPSARPGAMGHGEVIRYMLPQVNNSNKFFVAVAYFTGSF